MKVRRFSVIVTCLVLSVCALVYSAEYDKNGMLSLLKGDLNHDGFLDIADAILFASAWLEQDCSLSNHCAGADKYPECGDGVIDFRDFDPLADAWGSCTDPCDPCCTNMPLTLYEPPTTALTVPIEIIGLFSGEFYKSTVDMRIPGRGIDFALIRTYRSRTGTNTLWGNNWDCSYNIHIEACSGNIILHGPTGRRDIYYAQPNGKWVARGSFREISQNPDGSFTMLFLDKSKWKFNSFDATNAPGKINAIVDRNSNTMTFSYDALGRLVTIHTTLDGDSHNRDITIAYNVDGLVESVTDYTGREAKYEYYGIGDSGGSAGDLKSVTTPAVFGMPNGNNFPGGKKTVYTYTKGFVDERLNHNLLTITDPNGDTYLRNLYFGTGDPNDRDFDRVMRQIKGEPNDIIDIRYRRCAPRPGNNYAVTIAIVNDRAGNVRHYYFDRYNRPVIQRQFTGRAPDPDQYTDLSRNRPVGKLRPDDPDFYETRYKYNGDHLPVWVKYPNGNYTVNVFQGDLDPNTPPRSRGNLREIHHYAGPLTPVSDQNEIIELFEYDPNSNHGTNFPTRYVNGQGNERRYDYDVKGNRTRTTYKRSGPKPDIVVDYTHDTRGRPTSKLNPDNGSGWRRLDVYKYYNDANDPNDPNYGYLKNIIIDSNNLALTTTFEYNRVGKVIRVIDPNGNDTKYIRNQRNQVVRKISRDVGSGVRYVTDIHYDIKDNVVRVDKQNKDETGTLGANTHFTTTFHYGLLNLLTRVTREVEPNETIVREFEYDDNFRWKLTRDGEATNGNQPANRVRTVFDERNRVFRIFLAEGDPCQLTTQLDYDRNGNLKKVTRGLEGILRSTAYKHDGFNRHIETRDAMGNVTKRGYDAAGNLVSARRFGELLDVEGDAGNVRIADAVYLFDSMDRCIRIERPHFDPNTQTPIGDGNSVTRFFYSDNGVLTKTIDDNGNHTSFQYDTAGRLSTVTDAKDNIRSYKYDKKSNLIRFIEVDKSDVDDSNETFVTNLERDGLGRLTKIIDSMGNTTKYGYDSRGNRTSRIDALNNEIKYVYDGVGQLITTIRDMDGDGADPNDANDIVIQMAYDHSGRRISRTDDNANTTIYKYDALNRMTDILFADGTERKFGYDVHGNQNVAMDADGDFVIFFYDKLDRLTKKSIIPGPETAPTTTFGDFNYDGLSRPVNLADDGMVMYLRHDSLSNVTSEIHNGRSTSYTHDGMGNRLSLTYPGGRQINYIPDELNRTSILGDGLGNDLVVNKYIGPRRLAQADYRNGTRTIYQYDGMKEKFNPPGDFGVKQIIKTKHVKVSDGSVIDERTYKWDPVGNKKQRKDIRPGGPQLTHDYIYDRAYRLEKTTVTDQTATVVRQTTYDLDGDGNRKEVIGSPDIGLWVGPYIMDPTLPEPGDFQMNQYTTTPSGTRQYTDNGNLKIIDNGDLGVIEIKYDYRNRMVEHLNTGTGERHTYSYDALGRRTAKVVDVDGVAGGPKETRYYYAGRQVIEEQNPAGVTQATYLNEGISFEERFMMTRGGQDYYYHGGNAGFFDSPGDDLFIMTRGGQDVVAVTNSWGDVVERYRYADYGTPRILNGQGQQINESAIGNSYGFMGLRHDGETGFLNGDGPGAYDPIAGRFTTRGPVDNLGNRYTAFGNNPPCDPATVLTFEWILLLRTGGGINGLSDLLASAGFTAFGNNPGRDQARDMIDFGQHEFAGYVDKASTPFATEATGWVWLRSPGIIEFPVGGGWNDRGVFMPKLGGLSVNSLKEEDDLKDIGWIFAGSFFMPKLAGLSVNSFKDQSEDDSQYLVPSLGFSVGGGGGSGLAAALGWLGNWDTFGIVRGDGGQSPISSITIRANRFHNPVTAPGLGLTYMDGKMGINGGQSPGFFELDLGAQFTPGIQPSTVPLLSGSGQSPVLGLWGEVTWVGCLRGGEVPGASFGGLDHVPILNITDFILGDGF